MFFADTTDNPAQETTYKTRKELRAIPPDRITFTKADLTNLPELHPPQIMLHGNVGTPTRMFLKLIQTCQLPPVIIRKLGLTFPKTRTNKRYGNVPFDYRTEQVGDDLEESASCWTEADPVRSASGHELEGEEEYKEHVEKVCGSEQEDNVKPEEFLGEPDKAESEEVGWEIIRL